MKRRNVFSAAIIQQTGLRGQTLTGIRMEPLFGLEAGEEASLEPGLEALESLTVGNSPLWRLGNAG